MNNQTQEYVEKYADHENSINMSMCDLVDTINMSTINLEPLDNEHNDVSHQDAFAHSPEKQQNFEQPLRLAQNLNNSKPTGNASKITAYRKSSAIRSNTNSFNEQLVSEFKNYNTTYQQKTITASISSNQSDNKDGSYVEKRFQKEENKDFDISLAIKNQRETQEVLEILEKIEDNHHLAKKKVNSSDLISIDIDITAQTLNTCYSILSSELVDEILNFDREKMDKRLEKQLLKVRQDINSWNKIKGEFLGLSDPVVNKDILVFRLLQVKKNFSRQENVLSKLAPAQVQLSENKTALVLLKKQYEEFENFIFKSKLDELSKVKSDTETILVKMNSQISLIKTQIQQVKKIIQNIVPMNDDQRQKILSIQVEISNINLRLEQTMNDHRQKIIFMPELQKNYEELDVNNKFKDSYELEEMVQKSRKLKKIIYCLKQWQEFFIKLQQFNNQKLNQIQFDLTKAEADSQGFKEQVLSEKNSEFQLILKQIQILAQKVKHERDEQENRVDKFETQYLRTNSLTVQFEHIYDQDILFLKREIIRDKSALASINAFVNQILEDSLKTREDSTKENQTFNQISDEDLAYLKANLQVLQRQDSIDLPIVTTNIDQLFSYTLKMLRNNLNDDNKKSQSLISKMKKNYEDLSKTIESLNTKLQKSSKVIISLKELFQNEDLDRELEFKTKLDDVLETCAQEINQQEPIDDQKSLQLQKKEMVADINSMVTLFNENNKLIKQSNKEQKNEIELSEIIQRNKDVQKLCNEIEKKIFDAKAFAELIKKKLDIELGASIQSIQDKFQDKNKLIDECDEIFDQINQQIEDKQSRLQQEIVKLYSLIKKLEDLSPLNQPTQRGVDNTNLFQTIGKLLDDVRNLREELQEKKDVLQILKDELVTSVQPLNELADRTVSVDDVVKVKNSLISLQSQLESLNETILVKFNLIIVIHRSVEITIEQEKVSRLNNGDEIISKLEKQLDELIYERKEMRNRLQQLKELIQSAESDPTFLNNYQIQVKLDEAKKEVLDIQFKIDNLDIKVSEISKKTVEYKYQIDNVKKNQNSLTAQQLNTLFAQIEELKENSANVIITIQQVDHLEQIAIENLTQLIGNNRLLVKLVAEVHEISEQVADDLDAVEKVINCLPNQIEKMLATNNQMQKDASDSKGDYWEERNRISKHIEALKKIKPNVEAIKKDLIQRKSKFEQLQDQVNMSNEIDYLNQCIKDLKSLQNLVVENVNQAVAITESAEQIKHEMGDCEIPINIKVRKNELQKYCEKLKVISVEFSEIEASMSKNQAESQIEKQIQILIKEISNKLQPIKQEEQEMEQYLKNCLEAYHESDIFNYGNSPIIKEIYDFKQKILSAFQKLKDLDKIFSELNSKMIQNDLENAASLLGKRSNKLTNRLLKVFEILKKIGKAGDDMEGNASQTEEDELVDALKNEMPEVYKNIEINLKEIEQVEQLIKQVSISKDVDQMNQIKKQLYELEKKAEESDGLALKLENEIIEWNVIKKLTRRDEELFEVEKIAFDFKEEVILESGNMNEELEKYQAKKSDEKTASIMIEIGCYIQELELIKTKTQQIVLKRDTLFQQFDSEAPIAIIYARDKRNLQRDALHSPKPTTAIGSGLNKRNPNAAAWDKDIYYMLSINCKYRKPIHDLLKELKVLIQERKELNQKYAKLKQQLNRKEEPTFYKPVKGDAVDEYFAKTLNAAGLNIPVKRLGPGKYMFGSRQIMAKIINNKLVIRIGGGYMSAEEFVEQYGKIELAKLLKAGEIHIITDNNQADGAVIGSAEAKNLMKSMLSKTVIYNSGQKRDSSQGQGSKRENSSGKSFIEVGKSFIEKKGEEQKEEPGRMTITTKTTSRLELKSPSRLGGFKGLKNPTAVTKE